ncbi:MAG TPA: acetyl-CoA carboxylase carboxyl transferase subunit alpha [Verrucomicrobiales bacterium]|nr:acetyl-CoA carboxylase carboxyl transferase subunit alpha [Verrucomicrobiales bacterium]HAH98294.1 acetyl-CoA carboxylase carboxyl transferase subunit alpha [Verrucomicrobiales bacterium]|tara:strand:- start:956 stop:1939 length:984 start_codon:yes stop_codon:yes gene_type:complete
MKNHLDFEQPIVDLQTKLDALTNTKLPSGVQVDFQSEADQIRDKIVETRNNIYTNLTPWQRVQLARHPKRPYTLDYLRLSFEDFSELHGDRLYSDDKAMVCGFAMLGEERVMVIGTQKGRDTKENVMRNFGCAHPEGYRKALRLMKLADKFELPIITIIDTAGAFPGIGAEERHIAKAIAVNLREMMTLRVPVIAVVIGEGGSGGALGIGIADRVLVLENAYYSVISPEGCASILWKDRAAAPDAADALKITSDHLKRFGLVDEVIPEPLGGAHNDMEATASTLKKHLLKHIKSIKRMSVKKRLESRYKKFRELGQFEEEPLARNAS